MGSPPFKEPSVTSQSPDSPVQVHTPLSKHTSTWRLKVRPSQIVSRAEHLCCLQSCFPGAGNPQLSSQPQIPDSHHAVPSYSFQMSAKYLIIVFDWLLNTWNQCLSARDTKQINGQEHKSIKKIIKMVFYFLSSFPYSHPSHSFCCFSAYICTVSPLALFLCPQ